MAILLDNFIKDYKNPEQIMEEYSRLKSSKKNLLHVFITLLLRNMNHEEGMYPGQIKEEITKISEVLYKESIEDFLDNPSNLSKMLKELEDAGIITSIRGKKKIKEQSPKSIQRKPKVRGYQEEGPEGPPVVKKINRYSRRL